MLESLRDDCLVDNLNVFDMVLEHLAVIVVPASNLHVEDVVVEFLDSFELVREHLTKFTQRHLPLFAFGSAKFWHTHIGSL